MSEPYRIRQTEAERRGRGKVEKVPLCPSRDLRLGSEGFVGQELRGDVRYRS